jgi:L-ribulose-5-phosphate 4-epimerase
MSGRGSMRRLREAVVEANRDLVRNDLVFMTFGNASAIDHDAGVMAIKPGGLPGDQLTPSDVVLVRLDDGQPLEAAGRRPSSDTPTHLEIARALPWVGGIVHTHSRAATTWAQAGRPIVCLGTTHADYFRGDVPVTRSLTDEEIGGDYEGNTGRVIVEHFAAGRSDPSSVPAILVVGHGPFTWGGDAGAAVANAIALEYVADLAARTLALEPSARSLGPILLYKHHDRKNGPDAYYGQPAVSRPKLGLVVAGDDD